MSRSESPSKGTISDEDLIKKLKTLLIKEKKINKENNKIISELKEENDKKSKEYDLFIGQIQRLSENIGNLNDSVIKKSEEINNLSIIITELEKENENLKIDKKKLNLNQNQLNIEMNNFVINMKNNLKSIIEDNDKLIMNKLNFSENNDFLNIGDNFLCVISELKNNLNLNKNKLNILENNLSKITLKNNDLESIIIAKDETIKSLKKSYNDLELKENEKKIMVNNKIEELNNLSLSLNVLQKENERLKIENNKPIIELKEIQDNINNFISTIKKELEIFIECNVNLFDKKIILSENNSLYTFCNDIITLINEIKIILESNKAVNNVLQDGLSKITMKCNDMESIILTKDEKIKSLLNDNHDLKDDFTNVIKKCKDYESIISTKDEKIKSFIDENKELNSDEINKKMTVEKLQCYECIDNFEDNNVSKLNETHDLSIFHDIGKENKGLTIVFEEQSIEQKQIHKELNNFVNQIVINLQSLIEENNDLFADKIYLLDNENIDSLINNVINLISDIKVILKSNKEINDVLQDGLTQITMKCNDLDALLYKKDEKIEYLRNINNELDQKEEQIKHLEELIEANRNISRALETERDQLQNDLVDLRQRHEEKEGYLIEEFREAQLSLENYRIFTDKQSAEKANEIERLRKCIDEYQENVTHESMILDYSVYKDVDSLFEKLKNQFNIDNSIENYENVVTAIIDKYNDINITLNERIEAIRHNECYYHQKIELLSERLSYIEEVFNNKTTFNVELEQKHSENLITDGELSNVSEMEILDDLNRKLLEKEKKLHEMQEEFEDIKVMYNMAEDLLNVHDSLSIIEKIKKILLQNSQFIDEIELYKCQNDEQRSCHELLLQEKNNYISELTQRLTDAGKHVNHNDLMNLEMAEIDKTLVNLNNQLLTMSAKITDLESIILVKENTIETMSEELESGKKNNIRLDERNNKMKQMLVKTKRELADYKSQVLSLQEKESSHINEREQFNLKLEDAKVLLSESINEKEKLQERHSSFSKKTESMIRNKELTICSLKSQLEDAYQKFNSLQQEYDFYKVKVQNAFNTKARTPSTFSDFMTLPGNEKHDQDDSSLKSFKAQLNDLEMIIDDLKINQREKDEKISSLYNDLELIRLDNDKLSEKYKCLMKENNNLIIKMQQMNEQLQNNSKLQQLSHSDMLQRFNNETDKLNAMYQLQIESIRSNYEIEIQNIQQKLEESEIEKVKYQEEIWDCREQLKTADNKLYHENEHNYIVTNETINKQIRSPMGQERQQGEGMEMNNQVENVPSLSYNKILSPKLISKSTVYNNGFVSLDQLLNPTNGEEQTINDELIMTLRSESILHKRKTEHLTELLNDSEATVARLTEQAMLLKTEIRRLENNQERENLLDDNASKEYLKNVIIKFLHFDTKSDERSQLIPVIVTLLSLDPIEKELLTKFARIGTYNRKDGEGWSSYFSWTGKS